MRTNAIRSLSKIKKNVILNSRRLFSFKFEMTPRVAQESTAATTTEEVASGEPEQPTNFRYNVCQPRTSPVERPTTAGDVMAAQRQIVQTAIEQQQLQPSMLPEYYQKKMDTSPLVRTDAEMNEGDRISNAHNAIMQRRFQVSKTCANAILPLKSVKLANPFPDPVKQMMSRTVSDEEKAEQMLAESRTQRGFAEWGKSSTGQRNLSTGIRRWFSSQVGSDSEKCPKLRKDRKKGCVKMILPNCPPPARQKCERLAQDNKCKKQEAPYPAYSEFCHEDIEEKPSECKMCPWSPEEHPYFKAPKSHFHTSAAMDVRRSGLEIDWRNEQREPAEENPMSLEEAAANSKILESEISPNVDETGMLCDLRKPECQRPKNRICPEKKEGDKKDKKDKSKTKKPPAKKKASAEEISSTGDGLAEILEDNKPKSVLMLKKGTGCKIKKFKFPPCGQPIKRPRLERGKTGKCPPKKKKLPFNDCPPTGEDEKCRTQGIETVIGEYSLAESRVPTDKRKCPKVDLSINKPADEDDDPCKLKRRGKTKICPGDLLKRKRRNPRKKTSGIITPPTDSPMKEQPQPTVMKPT